MSTISSIMGLALSGAYASQAAIGVTSSNIANANTDGYTRQIAGLRSGRAVNMLYGSSLSGVEVSGVRRAFDSFLFGRINSTRQELSKYESQKKFMAGVEAVFDETEGVGLNDSLSGFWNAWEDLVNSPAGTAERSTLVSKSQTLAAIFNSKYNDLVQTQQEIDSDVSNMVDDINRLTREIAELNGVLGQAEAAGENTNAIKDNLEARVTELSSLADVRTYELDNGQICVNLSNGNPLVQGASTWSLGVEKDAGTGLNNIVWDDGAGNISDVTSAISGGALGGALEIRDETIPEFIGKLNELAAAIIEQVNALHQNGYDLEGDTGEPFFTGSGAGDMAVAQDIVDDPGNIAAASSLQSIPGDGSNAVAIAELQNALLMEGGSSTFGDFYSGLVSAVGSEVESIDSAYEYQSGMMTFHDNLRQSVSGVSLDEESANLVLYQNLYQASLEVMSILQEMLLTIINL